MTLKSRIFTRKPVSASSTATAPLSIKQALSSLQLTKVPISTRSIRKAPSKRSAPNTTNLKVRSLSALKFSAGTSFRISRSCNQKPALRKNGMAPGPCRFLTMLQQVCWTAGCPHSPSRASLRHAVPAPDRQRQCRPPLGRAGRRTGGAGRQDGQREKTGGPRAARTGPRTGRDRQLHSGAGCVRPLQQELFCPLLRTGMARRLRRDCKGASAKTANERQVPFRRGLSAES